MKKMKTNYTSPSLNVVNMPEDMIQTSTPSGIHNQYKPGEGLAPERGNIWK